MHARVLLTEAAERDLAAIVDYIAGESGSALANRVASRLLDLCGTLAVLPERGNIPPELAAHGVRQFRELHSRPYRVIYRVRGDDVVVVAIVDGRRNVATFLRERLARSG